MYDQKKVYQVTGKKQIKQPFFWERGYTIDLN